MLERALQACQRMGSEVEGASDDGDESSAADKLDGGVVPLLTEGCVLAWNLAQPLLQPHLRSHVHRILSTCVDALEDAGSPLQDLRAKLHFEVARCEMATDFLAKAAEHLDKARLSDYGYIDTEEAKPTPQAEERVDELVAALRQEHEANMDEGECLSRLLPRFERLPVAPNSSCSHKHTLSLASNGFQWLSSTSTARAYSPTTTTPRRMSDYSA